MSNAAQGAQRLRVAALRNNSPTPFDIRPDDAARTALTEKLGLLGLRKVRFAGEITPEGRDAWRLKGTLGATVMQACVVTLEPVVTRIEEPVERLWQPEEDLTRTPEGSEIEVPDDDADPLPDVIDLGAVLTEALTLALPQYPHAEGADAVTQQLDSAEEADREILEDRPNPFAALAGLRDSMQTGGEDDEGSKS
ncbi:metal-binding protein [Salipiger pallidus]|uniref:Metal-binding protein n=1 Tax=Salipiger pallidus TaxID=1775170 RepID=A0A8J2ZL26_9RHOB|nr:DUF177 domain-containing protein [Salipiger pallidus]GGG76636.1 metal-binding protein [Salipiger pallidus]